MATFELENNSGTSAASSSPDALDLGPVDPVMVELPQSPSVSILDPSGTVRRETVNGQAGMFFEYHYPEIVIPNYSPAGDSTADGPISVESHTSGLPQDDNPSNPRPSVINGRAGVFYPDISLQQTVELPGSSIDSFQNMNHLEPEGDGVTDGHPASQTCLAPETAFELGGLHLAIGGVESDRGSDPESIPEPESDNNGDSLSNFQGDTAPQRSVELVQPRATVEEDESDTVSEAETEPSCGYAHGVQPISKASQDSIRPPATAESDDSDTYPEPDTCSESDTYPEPDTVSIRGHRHDIVQINLVLKRWNAGSRGRSQPLVAKMFYRLPTATPDVDLICSYRQQTWFDLRGTFEKKMQFDPKADMLFIDDVGAARPNHFDQILEERVSVMASERLEYASPSSEVPWVYKIGIIFVDLTDPKAFMTYVRHSNPYIGMGVPYARKSPKDLHLIPSWQGDFMDLHLDHDRTLFALVHGKHVTAIRLAEMTPDPAPGTLQETDLLFVPPKDWAGGATRESLKLSVQLSCVPVPVPAAGSSNGGCSTEPQVGEQAYLLDKWNCRAIMDAWSEPVNNEGVVVKKLRLAQALLG